MPTLDDLRRELREGRRPEPQKACAPPSISGENHFSNGSKKGPWRYKNADGSMYWLGYVLDINDRGKPYITFSLYSDDAAISVRESDHTEEDETEALLDGWNTNSSTYKNTIARDIMAELTSVSSIFAASKAGVSRMRAMLNEIATIYEQAKERLEYGEWDWWHEGLHVVFKFGITTVSLPRTDVQKAARNDKYKWGAVNKIVTLIHSSPGTSNLDAKRVANLVSKYLKEDGWSYHED